MGNIKLLESNMPYLVLIHVAKGIVVNITYMHN